MPLCDGEADDSQADAAGEFHLSGDREATRELLEITTDTPLKISVEGRKLIIEPMTEEEANEQFEAALVKTTKRFAKDFKRLAK